MAKVLLADSLRIQAECAAGGAAGSWLRLPVQHAGVKRDFQQHATQCM